MPSHAGVRFFFFFFFWWGRLIHIKGARTSAASTPIGPRFFLGWKAYTQQGRAHSRRLHLDWAARPALMGRAARAVESKAVVRIEVAVSPRPCLGCAAELVLRVFFFAWGVAT
jgi:hypothetical protein